MASPASDCSGKLARPELSSSRSSSFHATSLAVAAARRLTLPAPPGGVAGSAVSLSGSVSPRSVPPHARVNYATFAADSDEAVPGAIAIPRADGAGASLPGRPAAPGSPHVPAAHARAHSPRPHSHSHSPQPHAHVHVAHTSPRSPAIRFPGTLHPAATSPGLSPGAQRRRSSTAPKYRWLSGGGRTGDEPGVDVRSQRDEDSYGHLTAESKITVVDYTSDPAAEDTNVRVEFKGSRLREWLHGDHGRRAVDADGRPIGVRWKGINWEVIKTLTLEYGLHPLAVEDALRSSGSPRSKLDFYRNHLYMQILVQHMNSGDEALISEAVDELGQGHSGVVDRNGFDAAGSAVDGATGAAHAGNARHAGHVSHASASRPVADRDNHDARTSGDDVDVELGAGRHKKEGWIGSWRRKTGLMRLPDGVEGVFEPSLPGTRLQGGQSPFDKQAHRMVVDQLSAKYMVPIRRGIMSIFMTRDGTLISLTLGNQCKDVLDHIYARLEDEHSLLRRSGDVGMLVQALLDVVGDLAIEAFEAEILQLESSVLVDPQVEIVRHLHILSSQLIRLRRSLAPLLHVCCIVRDQDAQRALAASTLMTRSERRLQGMSQSSVNVGASDGADAAGEHHLRPQREVHGMPSAGTSGMSTPTVAGNAGAMGMGLAGVPGLAALSAAGQNGANGAHDASPGSTPSTPLPPPALALANGNLHAGANGVGGLAAVAAASGAGFFGPMTKVYIGDVIDHLENIVGSMDQFVATCDHLTDYVFNTLAFRSNASMERLSIVTVVFLPLTFIASYFGMNFTDFGDLNQSVTYFWKIAAPCTVGFFVIFSWAYIRAGAETAVRRADRWRRTRRLGASVGRARAKRE